MAFKNVSTTRPMGKSALRNVELQKQMALMLQKQGMESLPSGNMAGRVFAPITLPQGLGKVANVGAGVLGQYLAGKRGQEIDDDRNQDRIDRVGAYLSDMKNTPVPEQGNPNEIFTGPQYSQGTPEVHAVPPSGDPFSPDANPYQPATEYQPATQGGELIGGNTHVPAQPAIAGLSREESAMKNLFTSDNPEMQELAMKMITGTGSGADGLTARRKDYELYKDMSPEEKEEWGASIRGYRMDDYGGFRGHMTPRGVRGRVDKTPPPQDLPEFKGAQTKAIKDAELVAKETKDKRVKDLQQANFFAQIDKAETLLGLDPTASGFGTMVDDVTGYFGGAFDSADVAESLRGVEAWMTSNVPRMEGPQSDNDIKMYKQMAAVIGDSTIPVSRRKAALKTLKDLQTKYITGYYHPKFGGTRPNTPNANTNAGNQPSPANRDAASNDVTERMKKYNLKGNQ
tara:strand:+ start:1253 stop:2620 length:1368 start_codon:yes stop_codon:yes gene_type:complete